MNIIDQLEESLPASTSVSRMELMLRLLVWAKLSNDLNMGPTPAQPSEFREALAAAGHEGALLRQAFPDDTPFEHSEFAKLQPALAFLRRMQENKILQRFNPVDAIARLCPDNAGLPSEVADFMVALANLSSHDSVYAPWDICGQLASRLTEEARSVYVEIPNPSPIPALISLITSKPFHVVQADPIREPSAISHGFLEQFDVAVTFPPLGVRSRHNYKNISYKDVKYDVFERFPESTFSPGVIVLRHLLAQAQRRIVVAVPNNILFGVRAEQLMRKDLLERGNLESVIAMPGGLFETTQNAFAVLIIDPKGGCEKVRFINADSPRFRTFVSKARVRLINIDELLSEAMESDSSDESATVPTHEILKNHAQLQVDRYILPKAKKRLLSFLSDAEKVPLGTLVKTFRPMKTVSEKENVDHSHTIEAREVAVVDMPHYGYIKTASRPVRVVKELSRKAQQQFLAPHDIVLVVKGSAGKVGIVSPDVPPSGEGGWVAPGSAIVLQVNQPEKIDPHVLYMLLRSQVGQALLNGVVSGATIPLIQIKELKQLELPFPDPSTSHRALKIFQGEVFLQRAIEKLQVKQANASSELWTLE